MIAFTEGSKIFPPAPGLAELHNRFRLPNPQYAQVQKMRKRGKRIGLTPPQFIHGCHWRDGCLAVPRALTVDARIYDRTSLPARERNFSVVGMEARTYQQEAARAFLDAETHTGLIEAPCGSGKTAIALQVMAELQTPALILVHTIDLAKQWIEQIERHLHDENGCATVCFQGGQHTPDVKISTIQTLSRWQWAMRRDWGRQFGIVISDECHHMPAETHSDVISSMPARYRLGLTATPERSDGLTDLLTWHFGETLYRVDRDQLRDAGQIMTPRVEMIRTSYQVDFNKTDWTKMLSEMAVDTARNALIIDQINRLVTAGHKVLMISERVAHAKAIAKALSCDRVRAESLTGSMSPKAREGIIREATEGKIDVLCATKLADEGLDMPMLSALVLAMPISRALNLVEQRAGRVSRPHPGKPQPVIIDFVDDSGALTGLAWKRIKGVYRKLGCDVEGM